MKFKTIEEWKNYLKKTARDAWDTNTEDPTLWINQAVILKHVADLAYDNMVPLRHPPPGTIINERDLALLGAIPVYKLILGLAFENLLKAIVIQVNPSAVKQNDRLTKDFKTHKLKELAESIGANVFELGKEEKDTLTELENHILWQGRYPIASSKDSNVIGTQYGSASRRTEIELWDRLIEFSKQTKPSDV